MAINLRILPIHAFLGDQQSHESITLAQIHSTGGSYNMWLNKFGSIEPIGGWSRRNPTAVTGGDGPMRLVGMYPYEIFQLVQGVLITSRQIIGVFAGTVDTVTPSGTTVNTAYLEIYKSDDDGVTWTNLPAPFPVSNAPGFTDILTDSVPYFAQLGTVLVITGPSRVPMKWNGSSLDGLNTLLTVVAPTVVDAGPGPLQGRYQWRVVDKLSDGSRSPSRPVSAALVLAFRQVAVSWAASVSVLNESYEVYRTTGTGNLFFYVGEVEAGVLTLTDALSDLELIGNRVLQEHGDPPPYAALCFMHKQRLWYGQWFDIDGNPTYPRRWAFSDPGMPDSVYQDRNFVDASDGDSLGDKATGGVGDYNGMAILFNERSIWTVSGTMEYQGPILDITLRRTDARTGAVAGRSIIKVPKGAIYPDQSAQFVTIERTVLAYLTPTLDVRLFDGNNDTIISYGVRETLQRVTFNSRHRIFALLDDVRSEIAWFVPVDGNDQPNLAIVWNFRHGAWYVRPAWAFACAIVYNQSDDRNVMLAGEGDRDVGGYAYQLWDGRLTADGALIPVQWMSKTIYGPARAGELESPGEFFSADKRWRWAEALFWTDGGLELEVAWLRAEASDTEDPIAVDTIAPGSTPLLTVDGTPVLSADGTPMLVQDVGDGIIRRAFLQDADGEYYYGRGVRLRIRSTA